jgi:hypothetical protein
MAREAGRLRAELGRLLPAEHPALRQLRADPAAALRLSGVSPDPWQAEVLRAPPANALLLCSRQAGKSLVAAALALLVALLRPGALVLLLSPTQRQSGEIYRDKLLRLYNALGRPVAAVQQSALTMTLANGSRVVSLPGDERSVRCYSNVALLVIDEAARVEDALYSSVRPMLAVSGGQLVALSTPFGRRGFFWSAWDGPGPWRRVEVRADQVPRITPEFLAEERRALGENWFAQEYFCKWLSAVGACFGAEDVDAAVVPGVRTLEFPA